MQHSPTGSMTWHPRGRMGVAAFQLLGGTEANLTEWGRWKRKTQARYYAKAPKSWKFSEHLSLPSPDEFRGFPRYGRGIHPHKRTLAQRGLGKEGGSTQTSPQSPANQGHRGLRKDTERSGTGRSTERCRVRWFIQQQ